VENGGTAGVVPEPAATATQLRVTVREPSGNLLSDEATIRLTPLSGGPDVIGMTGKEARTIGGEALIEIGPGECLVEAEAPGYQKSMAHTTVLALTTMTLRVYLTPMKKSSENEAPPSRVVMMPALKKEMDKATSALEERNLGDARKHLKKALAMAPSNPEALYRLGVVEYTDKNVAEAQKDFEKVLTRCPDHAGSLLMLGQIKLESGEKQGAVTLLGKAVQATPTKWLPHELLAYAYAQTGELERHGRKPRRPAN
jgi:tetratricopeptide (TPR) repeat protein